MNVSNLVRSIYIMLGMIGSYMVTLGFSDSSCVTFTYYLDVLTFLALHPPIPCWKISSR